MATTYQYEQFASYGAPNLAVQSDPIQSQLMYLDEREFPRVEEARPVDLTENAFAENLKGSRSLQALTK